MQQINVRRNFAFRRSYKSTQTNCSLSSLDYGRLRSRLAPRYRSGSNSLWKSRWIDGCQARQ